MQYLTFIDTVRQRLGITAEAARQIAEALLETLGESLDDSELKPLADQLPSELQAVASRRQPPRSRNLEDFYTKVAARADLRYSEAARRSLAVMAVMREAVSAGALDKARAALPPEFAELFEGTSKGPLSATP